GPRRLGGAGFRRARWGGPPPPPPPPRRGGGARGGAAPPRPPAAQMAKIQHLFAKGGSQAAFFIS
ncbi:hypothetical protein, partial [Mesorhizobium australicum]|uniref:hypothetical protein n=1 Tax=Mesorhizobium australicum TaxID=536018 RepID=UPI00333DD0F8